MTSSPPERSANPASFALFLLLAAAVPALGGCGYKGDLVQADPAAEGAAAKTGDEDADAKPSAQED